MNVMGVMCRGKDIEFDYRNWKGQEGRRRAAPMGIVFEANEWHPEPQWLMVAVDRDKNEVRKFAMRDMKNVVETDAV